MQDTNFFTKMLESLRPYNGTEDYHSVRVTGDGAKEYLDKDGHVRCRETFLPTRSPATQDYFDEDGLLHGVSTIFSSKSGRKLRSTPWHHGQHDKHQREKTYYHGGQDHEYIPYEKNNLPNGLYKAYRTSAKLMNKCFLVDGLRDGFDTWVGEDNSFQQAYHVKGIKNGPCITVRNDGTTTTEFFIPCDTAAQGSTIVSKPEWVFYQAKQDLLQGKFKKACKDLLRHTANVIQKRNKNTDYYPRDTVGRNKTWTPF